MFTVAFIHNRQKVDTIECPSTDEWINKPWYIQTMEYYSAIKRNEVLIHATTSKTRQVIMLHIMLSEISYT